MKATELTRRALAAALAVAAQHGLRCEEPEILRSASNLLVRLRPAPVVARVTTVTATMRPGDAWLAREVKIASRLAAVGAPVVPPSAELPPGPHARDGLWLSFWTYVVERPLDALEAGRRLRLCHDALERLDVDLPRLAVLDEADAIVERLDADGALSADDADLLRVAGRRARARIERLGLPDRRSTATPTSTLATSVARGRRGRSSARRRARAARRPRRRRA